VKVKSLTKSEKYFSKYSGDKGNLWWSELGFSKEGFGRRGSLHPQITVNPPLPASGNPVTVRLSFVPYPLIQHTNINYTAIDIGVFYSKDW